LNTISGLNTFPGLKLEMKNISALTFAALAVLATTTLVKSAEPEHPSDATQNSQITHCVVVQPIVVRDDEGHGAARMRVIESLVDQVYSIAKVDFHFLEPIFYDNTKARDGKIKLDQIVKESRKANLLRGNGNIINMFFVNAVDNRKGPLGRGQQNGSIVFIALGEKRFRAQEAFVVAHEAGHNLNLRHAVDDPNVPTDVPNLQGDGPFEERLGPRGLIEYQVGVIHKSHLVHERIRCLNTKEAKQAIVDETFEPYHSQLQRREIAALTAKLPTAETIEACRDEARQRFKDAVLPFTEREEEAVEWFAREVRGRLAKDYPLFEQQPWWFMKVKDTLCGGFSHTRGPHIIFSQRTVDRIVRAPNEQDKSAALRGLGPLFVHEQMHVLQRLYPERFASLYTSVFGLERGRVEPNAWLVERQISNPDGVKLEWIVAMPNEDNEKRFYWPRTILKDTPLPRMGRDFLGIAVKLEKHGNGYRVITGADGKPNGKPKYQPLDSLTSFKQKFPISRGLDHPNEIAAYMFANVFLQNHLASDDKAQQIEASRDSDASDGTADDRRAKQMYEPFRTWCSKNLRLDWEG
jgi:hypothetical protein